MKISSWKLLSLLCNDVGESRGIFSGQSENYGGSRNSDHDVRWNTQVFKVVDCQHEKRKFWRK